jgi:hypothetical protein
MDHHDGCISMIHEKINECEKVVLFLLNMKGFFNGFFYCFFEWGSLMHFYLYDHFKSSFPESATKLNCQRLPI